MMDSRTPAPVALEGGILLVFAILLTATITVCYGFGVYLIGALASVMSQDLAIGYDLIGTATALNQIGFIAAAVGAILLSRRLGEGRVVLLSVAVSSMALIGLSTAGSAWSIAVLLTITGACSASVYTPMTALAARHIPKRHRSAVMGLVASGTSFGVFLNGWLVPAFVQGPGWPWLWLFTGIAGLLLVILLWLGFPSIFLAEQAGEGQVDTRRKERLHNKENAVHVWALMFCAGFACVPFQMYLSPILHEDRGLSLGEASAIYGISGLTGMVGGGVLGALADRTSIRSVLLLCFAAVAMAIAGVSTTLPISIYFVSGALFGLVFQAIFGLIPAYIATVFSAHSIVTVFGIGNLLLGLAGAIGNYAGGVIKQATGSFTISLSMMLAFILIAVMLAWWLKEASGKHTSRHED